jgi:uncharacterized protein (DUF1778 family)
MSTPILSIRVSRAERDLLEAAAAQDRRAVGDFVRRKALDAAESELADRRIIEVTARDWAAFENWAKRPGRRKPALARLAAVKPAWER